MPWERLESTGRQPRSRATRVSGDPAPRQLAERYLTGPFFRQILARIERRGILRDRRRWLHEKRATLSKSQIRIRAPSERRRPL